MEITDSSCTIAAAVCGVPSGMADGVACVPSGVADGGSDRLFAISTCGCYSGAPYGAEKDLLSIHSREDINKSISGFSMCGGSVPARIYGRMG